MTCRLCYAGSRKHVKEKLTHPKRWIVLFYFVSLLVCDFVCKYNVVSLVVINFALMTWTFTFCWSSWVAYVLLQYARIQFVMGTCNIIKTCSRVRLRPIYIHREGGFDLHNAFIQYTNLKTSCFVGYISEPSLWIHTQKQKDFYPSVVHTLNMLKVTAVRRSTASPPGSFLPYLDHACSSRPFPGMR